MTFDEQFVKDTTDRLARIETKLDNIQVQRSNDRKAILSMVAAIIVGMCSLAAVVVAHIV